MHLFAGFIQLLLILSQSRYMPDMSVVWVPAPEPVMIADRSSAIKTIHRPLPAAAYTESCKSACCSSRQEGDLAPARQPPRIFLIPPSIALPAGEVIPVHKLYLMFCRLKIGGQGMLPHYGKP